MSKKRDLVQIIRDNPGCVAIIDNDHWDLYRVHPDQNPHDYDDDDNILCSAGDPFESLGDGGYGSGNCYGGDILQALAQIVGIKVESV